MKAFRWQQYVIAFLITAAIFATAFLVSERLNQVKLDELQATRDEIAIDTLSTETQFSLLAESSCEDIGTPVLSQELNTLASRLSLAENNLGANDADVLRLKKYYSLLLIKDYLLAQEIGQKCGHEPVSILYFYSNEGDCPDCKKEGYVLTALRTTRPQLRVYAFDTNLDLSAINTLKAVLSLKNTLPAIVVDGKAYYGFQSEDALNALLPPPPPPKNATSTATSTATTSTSTET
ncbi:MAG TPA: hypothetical protein VFM02_01605 [Candidatus Paceibacterota bacterium]|nr:hypothetical protein [Candidatus Paceibacterota bacterium]